MGDFRKPQVRRAHTCQPLHFAAAANRGSTGERHLWRGLPSRLDDAAKLGVSGSLPEPRVALKIDEGGVPFGTRLLILSAGGACATYLQLTNAP